MTMKQALNEFMMSKRLAGINENSIHNYRATISLMLNYIGWDILITDVDFGMISEYHLHLLGTQISKATKSSYIRNNKIFLKWIYVEHGLSFDPQKIKIPKSPKKNVHIYNNSELMTLFQTIETSIPWITARNRAIVAFMLDSGLRQHEVCGLLKSNIDFERMIVKITGKGAKDRLVPLGSLTRYLMNNYLAACPFDNPSAVFLDRYGKQMSGNAIRLFIYRLQKKLPFELSSHKLRHNFATNFCLDHLEQTGKSDVYDLSIIMGHESIETTKKYEHSAHEIRAAKSSISHLDTYLGNELKEILKSG